jgi:hypothetical protein
MARLAGASWLPQKASFLQVHKATKRLLRLVERLKKLDFSKCIKLQKRLLKLVARLMAASKS